MVIGRFQRRADGNFVGYIELPTDMEQGDRLSCLMVQDHPELGAGYDFMQMVWLEALGQ